MSATSTCRQHALPAGAATSRLDRVLAPLADLGGATRDEIAASLAPMAQELETTLERVATLEERVHDLESRLAAAAAAALGLPIPAAQPGVEKEPAPGKIGGHRRPILEPHRELILARLKDRPETTLLEMRDLLVAERGVRASLDTIWCHLARRAADI